MTVPLIGGIPLGLDLDANYVIQFTALNANTGAVDTSVIVSNASIEVTNVLGGDLGSGLFRELPVLEFAAEGS